MGNDMIQLGKPTFIVGFLRSRRDIWMFLVDPWYVYSWMDLLTNLKLGPPCKTLAHEIKCDQVKMRAALFSLLGQDFPARKPRCTAISCGLRTQVTQPRHPSPYLHALTRWNWLYNIPDFGLIQVTFKSNTGPFPSLPFSNSWLVAVKKSGELFLFAGSKSVSLFCLVKQSWDTSIVLGETY